MGCPCEIQLFAKTRTVAKKIADLAIIDISRLEAKYSRYRADSLLSVINKVAATGGSITIDEETASLLDYAETCYQQSDGLFDITSGILRQAWHFERNKLPDQNQINHLLSRSGWHNLRWQAPQLEFLIPGMELDFGGIVKEYAADRATALCQTHGLESGVVNLGGDVKLIGPRADDRPWRVGIQHPRNNDNVLTTLTLNHGAVASSGDYQRFMMVNGIRYSHVFNPKTGWPVSHLAAVTVISDFCVIAGSAATIAMLKAEDGPSWLESLELPYLWMDHFGHQGGTLINTSEAF
ncbi:thiamine biosynthesis protein ApbE [Methylomonas lenta]|uniref:FAD:protein FMN transferase n=1 Tax=Methylomonas lenta TaxID=980561 RepID=A0A177NQZ1_9GAMM|nr:FAD:protein FMN transferase [Methylomonas lenta]OAI20395.1 thiamine biosynthesis protein ApbE [Methylomonas lenta]